MIYYLIRINIVVIKHKMYILNSVYSSCEHNSTADYNY